MKSAFKIDFQIQFYMMKARKSLEYVAKFIFAGLVRTVRLGTIMLGRLIFSPVTLVFGDV